MPVVLRAEWLGRRVVIRRVVGGLPAGPPQFSDVVGDLIGRDASTAVVETAGGDRVTVPIAHIAVAREVFPSTADVLALEAIAGRGWRAAESVEHDGWIFRADHGFTGRANSVLPLRTSRDLDGQLAAARAWYGERGLPVRIQAPLPARSLLDNVLADRGWTADVDSHVLVGRLDLLSGRGGETAPAVVVDASPDPAWWDAYRYRGGPAPPVARELLVRHERPGFASIRRDGQVVAVARGAVDAGWLGVFGVDVAVEHRRQGLARALMVALWRWAAAEHGARRSYLQVESTNVAAVELYLGLGYWRHHDYRYRNDPIAETPTG